MMEDYETLPPPEPNPNLWRSAYVTGPLPDLMGWMCAYFPGEEPGTYQVQGQFSFMAPPRYAYERTGTVTDEETGEERPTFARIPENEEILVLVAIRTEAGQAALDDLAEKCPSVSIHYDTSPEQIAALYPAHALAQPVPRF